MGRDRSAIVAGVTGPQRADGCRTRPAGLCAGPGHLVVYGNPAFVARFGPGVLGMPAREVMVGLPPDAFELLDAVLATGRPLARWIVVDGERWRMTVAPRTEPGTNETYGVAFHLRSASDRPVVLRSADGADDR